MVPYRGFSDTELIGLLKSGDRSAFTEIFNRYQALLYIFAYKKIGEREEAKDLIHELFLTLWEKRESLSISGTLLAYLFTVVKHKVFDLYKHKKVSQRYLDTFQKYLDTNQNASDYLVRHHDLSAVIEKEIAALPARMREVFELSRKTNLSRKEIASELNLSEQTVKSHMHHALRILKTRLGVFMVLLFLTHP